MANLDLMSYERDSRWKPHLSWTYPDCTLQQKMEQQAAQREQAWQKVADKLAPLLMNGGAGSELNPSLANCGSLGQSDYISRDICDDQEYLERAYEKAPLVSTTNNRNQYNSNTFSSLNNQTNTTASNNSNNPLTSQSYKIINLSPTPPPQYLSGKLPTCQRHNNMIQHSRNTTQKLAHHHHWREIEHTGEAYHDSCCSQLFLCMSAFMFLLLLLLLLMLFFHFN